MKCKVSSSVEHTGCTFWIQMGRYTKHWTLNAGSICSCIELVFLSLSPLQILHLDLSSSIIPTSALESIICRCRLLECLSLEGLQLSDCIIRYFSTFPVFDQMWEVPLIHPLRNLFVMQLIPLLIIYIDLYYIKKKSSISLPCGSWNHRRFCIFSLIIDSSLKWFSKCRQRWVE